MGEMNNYDKMADKHNVNLKSVVVGIRNKKNSHITK